MSGLFSKLRERDTHLFLPGLGLWLDRHADNGLGENHVFEHDGVLLVTERIARGGILQADGRAISPE